MRRRRRSPQVLVATTIAAIGWAGCDGHGGPGRSGDSASEDTDDGETRNGTGQATGCLVPSYRTFSVDWGDGCVRVVVDAAAAHWRPLIEETAARWSDLECPPICFDVVEGTLDEQDVGEQALFFGVSDGMEIEGSSPGLVGTTLDDPDRCGVGLNVTNVLPDPVPPPAPDSAWLSRTLERRMALAFAKAVGVFGCVYPEGCDSVVCPDSPSAATGSPGPADEEALCRWWKRACG